MQLLFTMPILAFISLAASSMYSVQGQEMVDVVFEGIPDCFCLDGTVVVKSSTKGPALPKKPCAGHGGWALTSDSTQELTVNCKNQDCSIYDGFVLGFSDMPKVVNAKNAPQAHSIVIRTILLQEPKSVQDFKEIAEDMMMQQRKISRGLRRFIINLILFIWGDEGFGDDDFDEGFGKGADECGKNGLDDVGLVYAFETFALRAEIQKLTQQSQGSGGVLPLPPQNGIIGDGCIKYPFDIFEWIRNAMGLLGEADDLDELIVLSRYVEGLAPSSASTNGCNVDEAFTDMATASLAFWEYNGKQFNNTINIAGRRKWPWKADATAFATSVPLVGWLGGAIIGGIVSAAYALADE